jgi:hypothetical protein
MDGKRTFEGNEWAIGVNGRVMTGGVREFEIKVKMRIPSLWA